ncbi:MAG: hypothetical protein KBE91_11875 [Bacteroidia bacterium]|nr:hypothetical protein [Bacteroidia bacterium]
MNQYKLKYATQTAAEKDLKSKGIINEEGNAKGVHSVKHLGQLVDKPAVIVDGKIVTEATYLDGHHVDIATDNTYKFAEGVEQHPANPKHLFWI